MNTCRVEVGPIEPQNDFLGKAVFSEIKEDLFVGGIEKINVVQVFEISSLVSREKLELVCKQVFVDPVTETFCIDKNLVRGFDFSCEVGFHGNVTDNLALVARRGIEDFLGRKLRENEGVKSKKLYLFFGSLTEMQVKEIAQKKLFNPLIEEIKLVKGKK